MTPSLHPSHADVSRLFARRMVAVTLAAEAGGRVALGVAGALLTAEVKRIIRLPYPPASVPGEPPHARRGEDGGLLASYDYEVRGDEVLVGSDAEHSAYLEFGTSRMQPRPHLRVATANTVSGGSGGALRASFVRAVGEAMRAVAR